MNTLKSTVALAATAALALGAVACTPADNNADTTAETAAPASTTTIVEREVPAAPVVVEREVPVATPPVVIERDSRRDGDSTTVRAGSNGIEVETTNR
ncbi:hypothetical protein GGQ87_002247 [Brevundimonas alba]|uniref:Uncharacterized protein n=1 Tax=Brevundimonas alba TaxID=74314 RepID=A0A7X5YL56_9CAUL|nr:hypothetical protein [Brevundimonas alba]NJC41952.1 hypothetical protein [Brevundimonas alba]